MLKKLVSIILMINFLIMPVYADVLRGSVQQSVETDLPSDVYTGEFKEIDSKEVIEMTVEQVIDASLSLEGDEFFARVTSDVGKNGVVLPKGTVAHGKIYQTKEARRLGRDGYVS